MTEFQTRFLEHLKKCPYGTETTTGLAAKLKTPSVAVISSGRALERAGLVSSYRSNNNEFSNLKWTAIK